MANALLWTISVPTIAAQPTNQTVSPGATAIFSVTASGTAPLIYQWRFDGWNLNGQTNATLSLTNVQPVNAGSYQVVVANAFGSITSAVATLSLLGPPSITTQPQSRTNPAGTTAIFEVAATSLAPLSYQWSRNGVDLTNSASVGGVEWNQLVLLNVQAQDAGDYSVVVMNSVGAVTSQVAVLTVEGQAPVIFNEPQGGAVWGGQPWTLKVEAYGTEPMRYQWRCNGANLPAATNASLIVTGATSARLGDYAVVISNSVGSATSALASVKGYLWTELGASNLTWVSGSIGAARFYSPNGVAVDSGGNVYVADTGNNAIRKITPAGMVTTLTGMGYWWGSEDGGADTARFSSPCGIGIDGSGNVYVADLGNSTIRKITPDGIVTTLAGVADNRGSADGTSSNAQFYFPSGLAVGHNGNVYVADTVNSTIRQITPAGAVTTLAGLPNGWGSSDGTGTNALFAEPNGVAVDDSGILYVADTDNSTIRKVAPGGVVTTLAGQAGNPGSTDGSNHDALFNYPNGVAVDNSSNVYVADTLNSTIRRIMPDGSVMTLAGLAGCLGSADGTNSSAQFWKPSGIAVDDVGNVYVADTQNATIRKITPAGVVTTLAGSAGNIGFEDGSTWTNDTSIARDAGGAARTGAIADNQRVLLETTVGPGTLSFWWKVSSETNADWLRFSVNGTEWMRISGEVGWRRESLSLMDQTNVLSWEYAKNAFGSDGMDAGWVDQVTYVPGGFSPVITNASASACVWMGASTSLVVGAVGTPPLHYQWQLNGTNLPGATNAVLSLPNVQQADLGAYVVVVTNRYGTTNSGPAILAAMLNAELGTPNQSWGSLGNARWFGQSAESRDGAAARSGAISNSQQSQLSTVYMGPGLLTFWWKVSSQTNADFLRLYNNGLELLRISGEVGWQQRTVYVGGGSNVLTWEYAKDGALSVGQDAGWLDQVVYAPGGFAPVITTLPSTQVGTTGGQADFGVAAVGTPPLRYQWQCNGLDLPGATNVFLTVTNIQSANLGYYRVLVSNPYGLAVSSNAVLTEAWGTAAGSPFLAFTNGGSAAWFVEDWWTYLSLEALQSGVINTNQQTYVETTVQGPGTLSFRWMVSSEPTWNTLSFYSNGVRQARISGEVDWEQRSFHLPSGWQTLRWTYAKARPPASGSTAADAAWLEGVTFVSERAPVILTQPAGQIVYPGTNVVLTVTADGAPPLGYQWQFNGGNLPGATDSVLFLGNVGTNQTGNYRVVVSNTVSMVTSSNALLTVRGPFAPSIARGSTLRYLNGHFEFNVTGEPGQNLTIQVSTNLTDWDFLSVLTNQNGSVPFSEAVTNRGSRFYRVRQE